MTTIEKLKNEIIKLQKLHFPTHQLNPVFGGGREEGPKYMLIFINPTIRNISSDKNWNGPIFPFVGTKNIWRIFHKTGIFDEGLMFEINKTKHWDLELTNKVLTYLVDHSIYITNIVKLAGFDAQLPDTHLLNLYLPLLEKEIDIVRPKVIITFGLIPFNNLIKEKIKLNDYYENFIKNRALKSYNKQINGKTYRIIPSYFPIGRGNPKRAVEILKHIFTSEI